MCCHCSFLFHHICQRLPIITTMCNKCVYRHHCFKMLQLFKPLTYIFAFFGIIKLIVHVPAGACLDRDLCCKIVPSLTLGHYLHSISSYQGIVPLGTCTISLIVVYHFITSECALNCKIYSQHKCDTRTLSGYITRVLYNSTLIYYRYCMT